ncbi:uncharacterized protein LOC111112842 isoform X3 [Crassostrea virginica]
MDGFSNDEAGFQRLCESVFVRLCQIVGTSKQVAIRRETRDIVEIIERQVTHNDAVFRMESGSRREGFRLKSSDVDIMAWLNKYRVIWDTFQSEYYYTTNETLILSDSSQSPPGFTLLELLTPTTDREVQSACFLGNGRLYISSSLFRQQNHSHCFPGSIQHGPCESGQVAGLEYDFVYCFSCDFWPPSALSWINRNHFWPDKKVVDTIVSNGCHLVPIGNPLGVHGHDHEEWRISFSQAEYKLVNIMNHCQFLVYGLLKIFLKEVIDKLPGESNKLLCSYHMKTVVFWVIQQNAIPLWCPQNLLGSFWVCFKLLLKWVYEGVCPNFFIPHNNMFLSKIHGSAQRTLFLQLHGLYEKGLTCLLQSPSIGSCIFSALTNPRRIICIDENRLVSEVEYDLELFKEVNTKASQIQKVKNPCIKYLCLINQLMRSTLTPCQVLLLQKVTTFILQDIAFTLHNSYIDTGLTKQVYIADRMSCHMLKLAAKFGCISDMLYIAMYCYKTSKYRKALSIIENIKVKLAQPNLMYNRHVDPERYVEAVGRQSWSKKMRQAVAHDIKLPVCYIDELQPEHQFARQHSYGYLYIPLYAMLHFMEFLNCRYVDTTLAQTALKELQVLVHHDQGLYVKTIFRDISWEILGICQQMTGNLQAALYSYQQSLSQYPFHKIQGATMMRIQQLNTT